MIDLFPVASLKHLMVIRKQYSQWMNTVLPNMDGAENFYSKKLLKAKLPT